MSSKKSIVFSSNNTVWIREYCILFAWLDNLITFSRVLECAAAETEMLEPRLPVPEVMNHDKSGRWRNAQPAMCSVCLHNPRYKSSKRYACCPQLEFSNLVSFLSGFLFLSGECTMTKFQMTTTVKTWLQRPSYTTHEQYFTYEMFLLENSKFRRLFLVWRIFLFEFPG